MIFGNDITFANPEFFWLNLLLIPIILVYFFKNSGKTASLTFSETSVFSSFNQVKLQSRHSSFLITCLGLVFLITAIARPQSSTSWEEQDVEGIDIVLALDLSPSMLARDLKPNRFEAAKEMASEFVGSRINDRIGLVVYAGESFTQSPITTDKTVVKNLLKDLDMGLLEPGTAIGDGLATAVKRLKESEAESKVIILLTDGENTAGELSPKTAAELAKTFGIRVYTIGVGSKGMAMSPHHYNMRGEIVYQEVEVNIDEESLREIASISNGEYFRATSKEALGEIYKTIDQLEKTKISSTEFKNKTERFLPLALLGLLLLIVGFMLDKLIFKVLV